MILIYSNMNIVNYSLVNSQFDPENHQFLVETHLNQARKNCHNSSQLRTAPSCQPEAALGISVAPTEPEEKPGWMP
jgi:hypothetical protein